MSGSAYSSKTPGDPRVDWTLPQVNEFLQKRRNHKEYAAAFADTSADPEFQALRLQMIKSSENHSKLADATRLRHVYVVIRFQKFVAASERVWGKYKGREFAPDDMIGTSFTVCSSVAVDHHVSQSAPRIFCPFRSTRQSRISTERNGW